MHIYRSNPIPDHQNFFGVDENLGPVAVSLKREKLEDAPILHNLPPLSAPKLQYRFIARTSEVCALYMFAGGTCPKSRNGVNELEFGRKFPM